ncbi:MAG: DUF2309 domain-containing protein [Bacteroidia bacterium]|nr:DUF2309 domain-containing protein [Bacteroidia bacterium]
MEINESLFSEHHVLHELKHYLPAQAPLKDFIHHNTLHAFQSEKFFNALQRATGIFGFKTLLSVDEYRELFHQSKISSDIIAKVATEKKGAREAGKWIEKMLHARYRHQVTPRIGRLRSLWKKNYHIDIDNDIQPLLFRVLCNYLDQGIAMWQFPEIKGSFLESLLVLEQNSYSSLFRTREIKEMFLDRKWEIKPLLDQLVGDESLYEQYLFDQQFAHQGWSGLVAIIESNPQTLLDTRKITLRELIVFELLFELDTLNYHFGPVWAPLQKFAGSLRKPLFEPVEGTEANEVLALWQEAFEWTFYDTVLAAIVHKEFNNPAPQSKSFQAMFCIDDRECSLRRYMEKLDGSCETFGTPGFFGVEFFYKPEHGKFTTKLCPAPVTPKYLIKEIDSTHKHEEDLHLTKHSHSLLSGWLISQTLGFWSALRLFFNIFKPAMSPATATSFRHMDQFAKLTIECTDINEKEDGLQIGFTIEEMVNRAEGLLKSIGLVNDFAPLVYVIGHGSSSVNNPHYSAYDCGACSGRPGSVNARVICQMMNDPRVKEGLKHRGVFIPETTRFVAGLHDTTRDEFMFYDEELLNGEWEQKHKSNKELFEKVLDENAKERSRRFEVINTSRSAHKIHNRIKIRSVSLFEPRPELNHATNALCIIGRRDLTRHVFLDRRSFLNSYNYAIDPEGRFLLPILRAAAPVCGGINLEYFFSRVDNQKLGAGTKLPHNVMGLIGVANGIDGDLRPGLPSQMIEVHDPLRLLTIVEHYPDVILKVLKSSPETYEWFINEWIHLVAVHPDNGTLSYFKEGAFVPYQTISEVEVAEDATSLIENTEDNITVHLIKN